MLNSGDISWMLISSALVLLMTPGLAFFYGGLVRRKNSINTLMSSIAIIGIASILWVLIGYSLSFVGDLGGLIGTLKAFGLNGIDALPGPYAPTIPHLLFAIFQMMFAIITPALITGAVIERMKFGPLLLFAALWSVIVYYPLAHMVWGGGWLQKLGVLDFAGGTVVHISSGIAALVMAILVGKRKNHGKKAYRPHNIPFVLLGASLLWFGWFGFNAGSAGAANEIAVRAFMTTNTAAAAGMLVWMLLETLTSGKPTLVGCSTGFVVGLAAVTNSAGFIPIWAAIVIGALISPISFFFITRVKPKFGYDDALDVFGCHGIGGIFGALTTGLFAQKALNPVIQWNGLVFGETTLFVRQLLAIGFIVVFSAVATLLVAGIVRLVAGPLKVTARDEDYGLDLSEHGETAYPAFNGMDN
ncbi:ammonium transporter [Oscillospiraceae bacterium CM]|nr:ammonium transporter [Oscillospiraceae bacterium CM]